MQMDIVWTVAIIVFVVAEAATVGLVSIWFAIGALGALIACELGAQLWLQIVIFAVVSVAALLLTRLLAAKYINQKSQPTNADRLIGTECIVTECIDTIAATGAVTAQGRPWTARSATGEAIEPGALVVVESIEGAKLIVAPLNKKEATGG